MRVKGKLKLLRRNCVEWLKFAGFLWERGNVI